MTKEPSDNCAAGMWPGVRRAGLLRLSGGADAGPGAAQRRRLIKYGSIRQCDTRSHGVSGKRLRRAAYVDDVDPVQCAWTVPAPACAAGNCGVRSPGKCPRTSVPPGGHRLGKAGRVNESEPLMMPRHEHSHRRVREVGEQGPAAGRRRVLAGDAELARSVPPSPGFRGHPSRLVLIHAERGNPDGVRPVAGRPTVREA